jgi:hypothetical protein
VRNGLVYVLQNWRKHSAAGPGLDPCSSAAWFTGFRGNTVRAPFPPPVLPPRTWLAAVGWRRLGLIATTEGPATPRRKRSALTHAASGGSGLRGQPTAHTIPGRRGRGIVAATATGGGFSPPTSAK